MNNDSIILGEKKIYVIDVANMDSQEVNFLLEKIKKELKEKEENLAKERDREIRKNQALFKSTIEEIKAGKYLYNSIVQNLKLLNKSLDKNWQDTVFNNPLNILDFELWRMVEFKHVTVFDKSLGRGFVNKTRVVKDAFGNHYGMDYEVYNAEYRLPPEMGTRRAYLMDVLETEPPQYVRALEQPI